MSPQLIDGWYWPASDRHARPVLQREMIQAVPWALQYVEDRSICIQAGGCVGLYAVALANHFRAVLTFEPDPDNYECLGLNINAYLGGRMIGSHPAALGQWAGRCAVGDGEAGNCGTPRVLEGSDVEMVTIDALDMKSCGLIWLDIEGYELHALKGAETTIAQFEPVIILEMKGHAERYGSSDDQCVAWLAERDYHEVSRCGNDRLFKVINDEL